VAHDDEAALAAGEEAHEPVPRVDVEVVRRLVEQQQIRPAEQDPRELQAPALSARESANGQIEPVLRESEARSDPPNLGFAGVPARRAVALLEPGEPLDVAIAVPLLQPDPELFEPRRHLVEAARLEHVRQRGPLVVGAVPTRVLPKVPDGSPPDDAARRRGGLAGEDLQQARLPRSVSADNADLVAGANGEREALEDRPAGDLHREIADVEHDAHR
jgi:hypothetical protein